jgi:hypothetical protein
MGCATTWRALALAAWSASFALAAAAADYPIAGLQPDRRPAGAPVIGEVAKDEAWQVQATAGITPPLPASIQGMLADQGNWYTPFSQPGMTGPYDLRRRHEAGS